MRLLRLNFFITLIGFLDTHLLIPVIALYAVSLGGEVGTAGIVVGVYSLSNTFANVLGGRIVDRYGYKRPLIGGLLGDAAAMLAYSLCRFPWHLALVRLLHGFVGGFVGPATMSSLVSTSAPGSRGRTFGIYGAAIALATLLGYGGGGLIASRLGYNSVFFFGAAMLLIATVLAFMMPGDKGKKPDGQAVNNNIKAIIRLLLNSNLRLPYTVIFSQYFAFGGIVALLPLHLIGLNLEAYHMGLLLACFSLSFILFQFIGGRLCDAWGRLKSALAGLVLASASVLLLPLTGNLTVYVLLMLVYGAGFGFIFPAVSALVVEWAAAGESGLATGMFHALITVGVAVGAPLMGWAAGFVGIGWGISLSAVPLLLSLLLGMVQWRQERLHKCT